MARAISCLFEGKEITVEMAIEVRDGTPARQRKLLRFKCTECDLAVRPHRAGGNSAAHFEHLMRNPHCTLSDPAR
jgi:hypothetical protein